ncbi:hypothetical protein COHA_003659 [Chlorella ohadii]|uniref:Kazal-like domain-containing protein n=1 Tax=Chlorella ohadii TaxID=2649997 RepID=A0AAD5DYH1_9CHLO|nr:hypothetical protein COHA_003659 [Chlorella ohadii]
MLALCFAALLAARGTAAAPAACDCNAVPMTHAPVCGSNGLTLINACVAQCQGITVAKQGACNQATGPVAASRAGAGSPDTAAFLQPQHVMKSARVNAATLTKYSSEGFTYIARVHLSNEKVRPLRFAGGPTPIAAAARAASASLVATMVTPAGDIYARIEKGPKAAARGAVSSLRGTLLRSNRTFDAPAMTAAPANGSATAGRKLRAVKGPDDRREYDDHNYPWSAIGFIASGCTGALVGPRTVLTAGHCVYDDWTRQFMANLNFFPNRHSGGWHCHGPSNCSTWTQENRWARAITWYHNAPKPSAPGLATWDGMIADVAVIQLRDDVSSRGMLGLRAECNTQSMPVSTAGYPSDKPNYGSRTWFTWGQMNNVNGCGVWSRDAIATSTLDVAGGQSGSPMFHIVNGELVIRAILIASSPTTTFHRTVDSRVIEFVRANRV